MGSFTLAKLTHLKLTIPNTERSQVFLLKSRKLVEPIADFFVELASLLSRPRHSFNAKHAVPEFVRWSGR